MTPIMTTTGSAHGTTMEGDPGSARLSRCQVRHGYCRVIFWLEGRSFTRSPPPPSNNLTSQLEWERKSNRNNKNERHSSLCLGLQVWSPKSYQRTGPLALFRRMFKSNLSLIFPEKLKGPPPLGCRHHPKICWISQCVGRNAMLWVQRPQFGSLLCHLLAVWLWEST